MIAAVVILYHPNHEALTRLLHSIDEQVQKIFIVDNTPDIEVTPSLFSFSTKIVYLPQNINLGISKAQNIGIALAIEEHFTHVLLMDQDSCLKPGLVQRLIDGENALISNGKRVAAIGPLYIDQKTNKHSKAIRHRYLGAGAHKVTPDHTGTMESDYIIASGSLIRTDVLQLVGLMNEDMFIDGVDIEWGYRARDRGYNSYILPEAVMSHSIGDTIVKVLGKNIILHSDVRNFYIVRNACYLLTRGYVSFWLKLQFSFKVPCYVFIYSWYAKNKAKAFLQLVRACKHGLTGKLGPIPFKH